MYIQDIYLLCSRLLWYLRTILAKFANYDAVITPTVACTWFESHIVTSTRVWSCYTFESFAKHKISMCERLCMFIKLGRAYTDVHGNANQPHSSYLLDPRGGGWPHTCVHASQHNLAQSSHHQRFMWQFFPKLHASEADTSLSGCLTPDTIAVQSWPFALQTLVSPVPFNTCHIYAVMHETGLGRSKTIGTEACWPAPRSLT